MSRIAVCFVLAFLVGSVFAQETKSPTKAANTTRKTPVIAAWDVVPYQVIDEPFTVGVVAFHEHGCQVDFTVVQPDDSSSPSAAAFKWWQSVAEATRNERTSVWEYHITVDPGKLEDGPFAVQATATSGGQNPTAIDLPELPLYANGHHSLTTKAAVWVDGEHGSDTTGDGSPSQPLRTIRRGLQAAGDGGTVYLKAGKNYSADKLNGGKQRTYWTTIAAAPGVSREDVEIGPGRPGTDKLRFQNVTFYSDPPTRSYNTILAGENGSTIVWLDNCKMFNRKGRWDGGGVVFGNRYVGYVTGGMTTQMDNGPGGLLVRNHLIRDITSDALTSARTAINVEVRGIDRGPTDAHPDWHQSHTGGPDKYKTCILYNCSGFDCLSQGFFGHNLKDSAFVNCIFHRPPGVGYSQYSGHMNHVLWLHCTVPTQTWLWRGTLHGDDCYVVNGIFSKMQESQGGNTEGFTISHNHFINQTEPMGSHATIGDPLFVHPEQLDYHVQARSAAAESGLLLPCVPADINGQPRNRQNPTRGCYRTAK